jgi:hypothetical protein
VFYRLVQQRFQKRAEEDKAAQSPVPPPKEPEPEPEPSPGKSFRALARRSISFFRTSSSPGPSPAVNPSGLEEQDESPSTSPKSPDDRFRVIRRASTPGASISSKPISVSANVADGERLDSLLL